MIRILFLLLPLFVFAKECVIDYKMLYAIAVNEHHKKRDVGYPYLISFNRQTDRFKLRPEHKAWMLDTRTLDCHSQGECSKIASYLISKGVKNMDLGPFQICYLYHGKKMPLRSFFDLKDSFVYAKEFAKRLVKEHGCTWEALARYHSATKTHNIKYARRLRHAYYEN